MAPLPALALLFVALQPTAADVRADRNAGHVIGGVVRREGIGAALQRMVQRPSKVWVLGNSNANSDIDLEYLSESLRLPPGDVVMLSVPNANTAHFLAMTRKLRRAERRPELLLVVSRLQLMLVDRPISEGARRSLEALLGEGDDDLRALVNPVGSQVSELFRRREALRDRLGRSLRSTIPRLFAGIHRPDLVLRRALSDDHVDVDLLGRPPSRPLPAPEGSLLATLADTAAALDVDLVVARPPAMPLVGPGEGDVVPPGYAERTAAVLHARGASWLDLTALEMQPYHYKNADHLDDEGARRLTGALVSFLFPRPGARVGALGELRFPDGALVRERGSTTFLVPSPPLVDAWSGIEWGARDHVRWLEAPAGVPHDGWTQRATRLQDRCSPIRVWSPRGSLDSGWPCRDLAPGTSCHGTDRVGFSPSGSMDAGHRLVLDPQRSCDGGLWLYPGDHSEIRWPSLAPLGGRPTRLELEVVPLRRGTQVDAVLLDGADVVARGRVEPGRALVLPLPEPGDPRLRLQSDGYALVTRAELVRGHRAHSPPRP